MQCAYVTRFNIPLVAWYQHGLAQDLKGHFMFIHAYVWCLYTVPVNVSLCSLRLTMEGHVAYTGK